MADNVARETMSEVVSVDTAEKQKPAHLWKPGQSGNPSGRPKGARSRLDDLFVTALYEDFKTGGKEAIQKCREEKPDVYLNVIAKIVPKQVDLNADPAVAEFAKGLHAVAEFLGAFAAEGSSSDLAGMVPNRPVLSTDSRLEAN